MKRLGIAIAMSALSIVNWPSKSSSNCGINIELRHINGIWTGVDAVEKNLEALREQLGSSSGGNQLSYKASHNATNGFWDLYFQKEIEADAQKSRALALALVAGKTEGVDEGILQKINEEYQSDLLTNTTAENIVSTTEKIAAAVNASLAAGRNVVLVPHSQGCLFANSVYLAVNKNTAPSTRLKIVGVAETAASVAGDNTSYVTAAEDTAIKFLRTFAPGAVLPSNVEAGTNFWTDWFTSHGLQQVYLNPEYAAWVKVKQTLTSAIDAMQPDGKVLVKGSWDANYDGIDFRMLVNGKNIVGLYGSDPNLVTYPGGATYCADLPSSNLPTTFLPLVYNRGSLAQMVTVSGPLGTQMPIISAQQGIMPGMFFAAAFMVQDNLLSPYL